jgi:hypothetical protein
MPGVRFDFAYKMDYVLNVVVKQKNLSGRSSYSVVLAQAFPTEIYSLPLSWSQKDDYHRLNVVFAYRNSYVMYDNWDEDPDNLVE